METPKDNSCQRKKHLSFNEMILTESLTQIKSQFHLPSHWHSLPSNSFLVASAKKNQHFSHNLNFILKKCCYTESGMQKMPAVSFMKHTSLFTKSIFSLIYIYIYICGPALPATREQLFLLSFNRCG